MYLPIILSFLAASALASPHGLNKRATCSPDIERLAVGIQLNIQAQAGETASTTAIQTLLQQANNSNSASQAEFLEAKLRLLNFVTQGISIREENQANLPAGNPAAAGLAKVQQAQLEELRLAESLTGNPATDTATVKTLLQDFAGGTKQNMQNLLDATQGCTPIDPSAVQGIQVAQAAGLKASTGAADAGAGAGAANNNGNAANNNNNNNNNGNATGGSTGTANQSGSASPNANSGSPGNAGSNSSGSSSGTNTSGTNTSGTNNSGTNNSGTNNSGTNNSGTNTSGTNASGTNPAPAQSGNGATSCN